MTAANVLDTISRCPRIAGEGNDAVSAFAHVKMKDAPRLLKLSATGCGSLVIVIKPTGTVSVAQ